MYAKRFAGAVPDATSAGAFSACASGFVSARSARFAAIAADTVKAVSAFILSILRLPDVIIINTMIICMMIMMICSVSP